MLYHSSGLWHTCWLICRQGYPAWPSFYPRKKKLRVSKLLFLTSFFFSIWFKHREGVWDGSWIHHPYCCCCVWLCGGSCEPCHFPVPAKDGKIQLQNQVWQLQLPSVLWLVISKLTVSTESWKVTLFSSLALPEMVKYCRWASST